MTPPEDTERARELVEAWCNAVPLVSAHTLVDQIAAVLAEVRREERERDAHLVGTYIARDLATFNSGLSSEPLWTTALVEACGPVLRQIATAIRRGEG